MSSNLKSVKMYNLNVNVATTSFLGLDGQCNTPRTPEIVNSLVAMTNPFDALMKSSGKGESNSPGSDESYSGTMSPLGSPISSPPSVQHTRSQLIKEGLKLTIQTKRKHSGSETKEDLEEFESKRMKREEQLTEEDEERRKRRRERNKIAATKCRMKKREKTANLVSESELLETQNIDLKAQIQDLQKQKRKLIDMLSMHSATCVKQASNGSVRGSQGSGVFEDFVGGSESYGDAFAVHPTYSPESQEDFQVGSTNGTAMNPYGKDPNFAKLLDDVAGSPPNQNYSRSYERAYVSPPPQPPATTTTTTTTEYGDSGIQSNFYQTKNRKIESGNKLNFAYQSEQKSDKIKETMASMTRTTDTTKAQVPSFEEAEEVEEDEGRNDFRGNFHSCHDSDGPDSYKPNGIIDGNFFANRTDVFAGGNEYSTAFGTNPLDNGCLA